VVLRLRGFRLFCGISLAVASSPPQWSAIGGAIGLENDHPGMNLVHLSQDSRYARIYDCLLSSDPDRASPRQSWSGLYDSSIIKTNSEIGGLSEWVSDVNTKWDNGYIFDLERNTIEFPNY